MSTFVTLRELDVLRSIATPTRGADAEYTRVL